MKSLAIIPVYKEAEKVGKVLERFQPGFVDEVCLVVDNPDSRILNEIGNATNRVTVPTAIIQNDQRRGIGRAIKQGYKKAYELLEQRPSAALKVS